MAVISEAVVRELAGFKGREAPVTTCYLNVDGRRLRRIADCQRQLDRLVRDAPVDHRSVAEDLDRITRFVGNGFDRSGTRGLAFFSCSAHGLWEVVQLPVPVRDQLVVNNFPAVGQLEAVVQEYERIGVLLVDRQRARMMVFDLGELVDRSELLDDLPRDYDTRGQLERGDHQGHVEALAAQHLRRAAQVAFQVFQEQEFQHLTVGAPDEIARQLEGELHPYLRQRLCARVDVDCNAPLSVVREAVLAVEAHVERAREQAAVDRLRAGLATGQKAVGGLAEVLEALNQRRAETLLVSQGYASSGWRCQRCGVLASVGRECPLCGDEMAVVDDVVEEAVEEALAQSCAVEICVGNADLDVVGRIGALLRF